MAHTRSKIGRPKHIKRTNAGRFGMQLGCSKYLHIKCFRSGTNGLASPRRLNAQAEQLTGNIFKIHLLQGEESLGSRSSIFADWTLEGRKVVSCSAYRYWEHFDTAPACQAHIQNLGASPSGQFPEALPSTGWHHRAVSDHAGHARLRLSHAAMVPKRVLPMLGPLQCTLAQVTMWAWSCSFQIICVFVGGQMEVG